MNVHDTKSGLAHTFKQQSHVHENIWLWPMSTDTYFPPQAKACESKESSKIEILQNNLWRRRKKAAFCFDKKQEQEMLSWLAFKLKKITLFWIRLCVIILRAAEKLFLPLLAGRTSTDHCIDLHDFFLMWANNKSTRHKRLEIIISQHCVKGKIL